MAYLLSNLLQDAYRALGKTDTFILTGGSTTTIIDTKLEDKYQDDDLKNWTCFITRDAGGLNAAPENEFNRISGYVESTNTATVDTAFTISPAAGDTVTLTSDQFPLREMMQQANIALRALDYLVLTNTSLTSSSTQTEYDLPVALKADDLVKIEVQTEATTDDYQWETVPPDAYYILPASPGSTGEIIFEKYLEDGKTIRVWYEGLHPDLTAYNSVISETIHPTVAWASLVAHALQWYNTMLSGQDEYYLQRENKAWRDLEIALAKHPIYKPKKMNRLLTIE